MQFGILRECGSQDAPSLSLDLCGDAYEIVVAALGNHQFRINENFGLNRNELVRRLNDIMKYRADKVIFLWSEPEISYGDFIELTDAVYQTGRGRYYPDSPGFQIL